MVETDAFKHSLPALYDKYMVPLLFEPYARIAAERAARLAPADVLETAAGTGVVTRALTRALPQAEITATDINPAVVEYAQQAVTSERISFAVANAQDLSYEDDSFDLVVCCFGAMFFPDKVGANTEARRVLRPGGHYLLITFDDLARNPVPRAAGEAVAALMPDDPPQYMQQGPFSYTDPTSVEGDLVAAGFTDVDVDTVALTSRVDARDAAQGMVLGSPFRAEIAQRDPSALDRALEAVVHALAPWDGKDAPMSAHVVTARA